MAETGKEILDRVAAIKNGHSYDGISAKSKAAINGGVIGLAGGFYYAYAKQQNFLVMGLLGAISGALIVRLLMPKS